MNNERVMKEIAAIQLLAESQALLVTRADASSAHTESFSSISSSAAGQSNPRLGLTTLHRRSTTNWSAFLEGTIGFVDASNEEVRGSGSATFATPASP